MNWPAVSPRYVLPVVLVLFLALGIALSVAIPLGETPDELAHFSYIQFIARYGRLPETPAERQAAGYRADWPGLYQLLAAPVARLAEALSPAGGPTELKVISANPRRLLPLDGFGGMVVLHTDDESPPYKGIAVPWHAARLVSVVLSVGTLLLIFVTLRRRVSETLSLAVVVVVGLVSQFLVSSAVLNDDSLLGLLVVLFLWLLWPLFEREGGPGRYLALGVVAGLALVTKYSTLFLVLDVLLLHVLVRRRVSVRQAGAFVGGAVLGAGWWFGFVLYHFNQVSTLGWSGGLLAPFLSGGTDVSTRRIAALLGTDSLAAPLAAAPSTDWLQWAQTLFATFWFPHGVTIRWWLPLLMVTLLLAGGIARAWYRSLAPRSLILFAIGHILLFVPLPLLRFLLTQNVAETAQGRHILFPILLPLAYLLVVGVRGWLGQRASVCALAGLALFFLVGLAGLVWPAVTFAGFPYFPVRTTLDAEPQVGVNASYRGEIVLLGLDKPPPDVPSTDIVPLTLVWQARQPASVDYSVRITLWAREGRSVGLWRGQPVNGRYPTRAWDKGDVVYHTIWVPLLPGTPPGEYAVTAQVLDDTGQPVPADASGLLALSLGYVTVPDHGGPVFPNGVSLVPRGDGFATTDPYRARSTVALVVSPLPGKAALRGPDGTPYAPLETLASDQGAILLFAVEWTWPTGDYSLVYLDDVGQPVRAVERVATIQNNFRPTTAPAISRPLNARLGDQFVLLGYDLPRNRVQPGQGFDITLYWQCLRTTNVDYKVFNHLLDVDQVQRGGIDRTPQNFYSTVLWKPGEVVTDRYTVPVAPDAANGLYWLDVGLYPTNAPERSSLPDLSSVWLGPVKVGGQPAASIPRSAPQVTRNDRFGGFITLSGYTMWFDAAQRVLHIDVYWTAIAAPPLDYTVFVHVVDGAGAMVAQHDSPPVVSQYPTSFWEVGERILDQRQVSIPNLPAGVYQVRMGWYDPTSGQRLPVLDNPAGFVLLGEFEVR